MNIGTTNLSFGILRELAISSVRSHCRSVGIEPHTIDGNEAWVILDEIARYPIHKNKLFRTFHTWATENQIKLFVREWNRWSKEHKQKVIAFDL